MEELKFNDKYSVKPEEKRYYDFMVDVINKAPYSSKILYVGMRKNSSERWLYHAHRLPCSWIDILEVNLGNYAYIFNDVIPKYSKRVMVYHKSVEEVKSFSAYDLVIWEDGPEHLSRDAALAVMGRIVEGCKSFFIAGPDPKTSKGVHQKASPDNPNEEHKCVLDFFDEFSMFADIGHINDSIILWR